MNAPLTLLIGPQATLTTGLTPGSGLRWLSGRPLWALRRWSGSPS